MAELLIGSHLSTSGGWGELLRRSHEERGTTFAFFPRSPYGKRSKSLDPAGAHGFAERLIAEHYGPLVVHAPTSTTSPARTGPNASSPYRRSPRTSGC